MIYLKLLFSFLQIGAFSFGGGYAALPLIQNQVVEINHWLTTSEFTDLITISQMTPGPIAINAATFVGIRTAGIPGAMVATLGSVLPSCIIVTIIAAFYMKYRHMKGLQTVLSVLRPAVVALIATAGIDILLSAFWGENGTVTLQNLHINMVILCLFSLYLLMKRKMDPVLVMVIAGVLNVLGYFVLQLI